MKYCIDFYGDTTINLLNIADEINIELSKIKDLIDLAEFCELHKNQGINLYLTDYEEKLFNFAFDFQKEQEDKYNIKIKLPYYDEDKYQKIIEKYPESKFFYATGVFDWDTLYNFLIAGVSDIYIVDGLGFELDKISAIMHEKNIQIRVYPNIAQPVWGKVNSLQKFWIRPEDTEYYEDYIDIYEFAYDRYDQQKVYYDIYFNDKKWYGDLSEIIIGLTEHIDSTCLLPRFVEKRVGCNRQCLKYSKCQMCDVILQLANTLEKKELIIEMEKEKEKDGERSNSESGSSEENIE